MPVVRELTLRDFRNYAEAVLRLNKPGLHVLWGPNGQGKTSLLEALYFSAFLRSFRTALLPELVREGCDCCELRVCLAGGEGEPDGERLLLRTGKTKTLRRNDRQIWKASEFIQAFACIALVPEDRELISGAPARRRQFMDMLLSQLDPQYLAQLAAYRQALRSRNSLFRQGDPDPALAGAFGELLARHGAAIVWARQALVDRINAQLQERSPAVTGSADRLVEVQYKPNCRLRTDDLDLAAEGLRKRVQENWGRDLRQGCSTTGPHRDDLAVLFNGRSALAYGSHGERRLSGLLLKLASLHLVHENAAGRRPVLLLIDDVLGDLDGARRRAFLECLWGADQLLLVQTSAPDLEDMPGPVAGIHQVSNGSVISQL